MDEKARLTLEYAIHQLDKGVDAGACYGSWRAKAEQVGTDDENSLYATMSVTLPVLQALSDVATKMLIGENILTPSLVTRGWKFWKHPPLTGNEKKAVESAVMQYSEAVVTQFNSLRDTYKKLPNTTSHTDVIFFTTGLDTLSSCMQQLSADLKQILASAKAG